MEKLEQVDMDCVSAIECTEFEVCIQETEVEPEVLIQLKEYKNPVKYWLSKLFKKSKLNANHAKETIPIDSLKYKQNYRIYAVY
jgi:hypothetical protein